MISIISSLYKSDQYLPNFQKSLEIFSKVLLKKNLEFELIVIANEVSENEKKFASHFKNESWFKFFDVKKETLYTTWNRGVALAKGGKVGFWNVDDIRFGQAIIEADGLFANGAELVYFPFKIDRYLNILGLSFLVHKQLIDKQIPEFTLTTQKEFQRSMFCGPFFMFSKSLYEKVGPFDEQFKIAGDFDWCTRAAKISAGFVKAKSIAGEFRVDGSGLSSGKNATLVAENNVVCRRQGVWDKITKEDLELAKQYDYKLIKHGENRVVYV